MKLTDTFTVQALIDDKLGYLNIVEKLDQNSLKQLVNHKSLFIREMVVRNIDPQYLYLMENDEDEYIRKGVQNRLYDAVQRKKYSKQDIEKAFETGFKIFVHNAVTISKANDACAAAVNSSYWPEEDLYSEPIKKARREIMAQEDANIFAALDNNKNLNMTTLQDLVNQGQATCVPFAIGAQTQFQFSGAYNYNYGNNTCAPVMCTATGSGPVQTVSWGSWTGAPIKSDQTPGVEKIQAKVSGPVTCTSCNQINEYAEPNQKDGTYICYNCK